MRVSHLLLISTLSLSALSKAHGVDSRGTKQLDWHTDQISSVLAFARVSSKAAERLHLFHKIDAGRGGWFVVKAQGASKDGKTYDTAAVSAPIYVHVDESGFCKLTGVEAIVADLRSHMRKAMAQSFDEQVEAEQWDTWEPRQRHWPANKALLERRMREVNEKYEDLAKRANRGLCK